MKKSHLLLMASGLILASCAEDLTPQPEYSKTNEGNVPMSFNFRSGNMTRDDAQLETVHGDFGVWAYKSDNTLAGTMLADGNTVMNNYLVGHSSKWPIAASVQEGTHSDWWYENLGSTQYPGSISNNPVQYLKFWDLGKKYTSFFAYAPYVQGANTPVLAVDAANDKATLTFNETLTMGVESNLMFAGRVEENADHTTTAKVPLHFNRLTSKIRMAVYEAIPGWHVEMVNAEYIIADNQTVIDRTNRAIVAMPVKVEGDVYTRGSLVFSGKPVVEFDLTPANVVKGSFNANSTATTNIVNISYTDVERHGDEPHAFLEFALPSTNLTKRVNTEATAIYLSESRDTPSFSGSEYDVIPNSGTTLSGVTDSANDGIQLVMNFRLVADDTAEVIEVKNARVTVPASACQWAPNTLYTYIFKITKDVSGTTENEPPVIDPEKPGKALYPIIFDDVVVKEMEEVVYAGDDNTGYPVN